MDYIRRHRALFILFILTVLGWCCSAAVADREADSMLAVRFAGSLCLMSAIAMVSLATGLRVIGTLRRTVLTISLAFLIGYGLVGMLVFIAALLHALYPAVMAALLVGLGVLFRVQMNELPSLFRHFLSEFRHLPMNARLTISVVAAWTCFLLLLSLGPVNAWDAQAFHWTAAKYFARNHAVPFPDFDGNGGTPQLVRMLFAVFCVFHFDHQASHAVWLFFPALLGLVYGVVRSLSSSTIGLALTFAAFLLLVLPPEFITEPVLGFPLLVFGLAAFGCVLAPYLFDSDDRNAQGIGASFSPFLVISGILAGFALATKWQAFVLLPVLLVTIFSIWFPILPATSRKRLLLGWSALVVTPAAAFALYNLVHTGNPFWHPMIPVFWDPDYWASVTPNIYVWRAHMDFLLHEMYPSPFYSFTGALICYLRGNVLVIPGLFLALLALFADRRRFGPTVWFMIGGGLFCVLLHSITVGSDLRNVLLGTGMMLLAIPIGWDRLKLSSCRRVAYLIPILAVAGVVYKVSDFQLPIVDQYISRSLRVLRGPYFDDMYNKDYFLPAAHWANRHLPLDARVITDARLLGNLDRNWMTIWPVAQCLVAVYPEMSADSLRHALGNIGITHLLVDESGLWKTCTICPHMAEYMAPWGKLLARDDWLEPVYADGRARILRLRQD